MKKYRGILLSVSVAAMLLGTSAAVYAEETEAVTEAVAEIVEEAPEVAENGLLASDVSALETYAEQAIMMITGYSDEEMADMINPSSILSMYPESAVTAVQSWQSVKDDLGALVSVDSYEIDADKDIVIVAHATFENAGNDVTLTISRDDLTMESLSFDVAKQTMGQKMKEAVLNTLMGVCIVFLMLLFLSFLISQFKHISTFEESLKKKNAPAAPAPAKAAAPVVPVVEEEVVDDGELIAVIAAAIAAAEGTSTDGFVVRSIKKSNRKKWQRA